MNILPALHLPQEKNECVKSSPATKSEWLNSLHRGCLSKDTSDKFRLYSHLRALPSRKLPHPFASDEGGNRRKSRAQSGVQRTSYKQPANIDYNEESEAELSKAYVSPVFREDSTRPPEASEEVTPELFTVDEFFNYLWSDNWREEICLRVVGGKLLKLLLTALYHLEQTQKLNSHIIRANLNNRRENVANEDLALNDKQLQLLTLASIRSQKRRKSVRKEKISQQGKRSKETIDVNKSANFTNLPAVTIPKPLYDYEPVRTDLIYKGGVKHAEDFLSRSASINYKDDVKSAKNSLSKYAHINYRDVKAQEKWSCESMVIQLIFYEKADKSNITYQVANKAYSNMQILLPRHVLYPAYSLDQHNMKYVRLPISENVDIKERIATLTLELDDSVKLTNNKGDGKRDDSAKVTNNKGDAKIMDPSLLSVNTRDRFKLSKFASDTSRKTDKQLDRRDSEYITDNVWFDSQPVTNASSRQTISEKEEESTERARSSSNVDHLNSLLSLSDNTDTSTYKTLNLSRKEMYITGLYVPRTVNNVPVQVKLQSAKLSKHKVCTDNNLANSSGYTSSGAPHASLLYPSVHSQMPYHLPDSRIAKTKEIKDHNVSVQLWNQYIKEQEEVEMEMELALNNNLAKNISDRLYNANRTPIYRSSTSGKRKAKGLSGKKVAGLPRIASGGDSTAQLGSRQSGKRNDEESPFPRDTPSRRPHLDTEELLDKMHVAMNFNSNSIVDLPRRRTVSKRYLYVHEFQEPIIRTPRPPSDYENRRSYQIMKHTPYCITSVTDGDSSLQGSEKNYDHYGIFPKRMYPGKYRMHDGNWSHMGLYPSDVNDHATNLSPPETAHYQCPCEECHCLREALADLKPDTKCLPPGFRHRLGKLRTHFDFQKLQNYKTPITVKQTEMISHFTAMDVPQICDQLMSLIDNVMFRKEILTSSLGRTYITVTFSKERTSTN